MEEEEFRRLSDRFDSLARSSPRAYRWRVTGLVALGYGYVLGVVALLVGLNVGVVVLMLRLHAFAVMVKLLLAQAAVTWAVLRSLWVRMAPPEGVEVTAAEAPALFRVIAEVRQRLRTRPVHTVLITGDLNASLAQVPRLGVLGWHRNYLSLGLPLLEGLPVDEARAVIAHELAHLSAEHNRRTAWVYRVQQTWNRLLVEVSGRGSRAAWLFRGFARWFVSYLNAATLALLRADEHEADRLAAHAAGAGPAASALARSELLSRRENQVLWPAFTAQADHQREPPTGWPSAFVTALARAEPVPGSEAWLAEALAVDTPPYSSHPSLRVRLREMGIDTPPPVTATPPERSAARELLGPLADRVAAELDRRWLAAAREGWRTHHDRAQQELRALEGFDARADALAPAEALERAYLVERWRGAAEALPLFAALAEASTTVGMRTEARLSHGRLLLDAGDEAGLAELERAVADAPGLAGVAGRLARAYLVPLGRADEAETWARRAREEAANDAAALEERDRVSAMEAMEPHTATPEQLASLRRVLAGEPGVRRAWLVRRGVRLRPEWPAHFLVLELTHPWLRTHAARDGAMRDVADRIGFLEDCRVIEGRREGAAKRAARVPSAEVFTRLG
jgi:Zn-dependent protease with chaperone function